MKNLFLTEEEKSIILEKHKNAILKENRNNLIVEQTVPVSKILSIPSLVFFSKEPLDKNSKKQNDTSIIYLSQLNDKHQRIPNSTLSYKIGGTYDAGSWVPNINFDVNLRNVSRTVSGRLVAEVQPSNSVVKTAMSALVKKEFLTSDGWLKINIPAETVNKAITDLSKNNGKSSIITIPNESSFKITVTQV